MTTFRTPSDISDARARWAARVALLAARLGVAVDHARAMAIELSTQRGITVDALDRNQLWKNCGVDESPASVESACAEDAEDSIDDFRGARRTRHS